MDDPLLAAGRELEETVLDEEGEMQMIAAAAQER
jgi:hypothetical protein